MTRSPGHVTTGPPAASSASVASARIAAMPEALVWAEHAASWPNAAASRFVEAGGVRFHVQVAGSGPVLLLLHGATASSHSWRDLLPRLADRFTVVAPDLPGHGFSACPSHAGLTLPGMARGIDALLRTLDLAPVAVAGHSAGAAVLARMCLDRMIRPARLVSINGALVPLHGVAGLAFAPIARTLANIGVVPRFVAGRAARPGTVERLLRDTGSSLDATGVRLYRTLASNPAHVAAALAMMARWDLVPLERDLPRLATALDLVVAANDRAVTPRYAERVQALVPAATRIDVDGLGHLAHEEAPERFAALLAERCTSGLDAPACGKTT